jgi:glycosyltransferase involved in cell wall biosynthesis
VIDPSLRGNQGHNFAVALAIQEECGRRGIPFSLFCNARASASTLRRFRDPIPLRTVKSARMPEAQRLLVRAAESSRLLARQLERYLSPIVAPDDVVLVHTISERRLPGLAMWYSRLAERRPRLAVGFMAPPGAFLADPSLAEFSRPLTEYGLRLLRSAAGRNLALFADSEALARSYSELAQLPVRRWPMPIDFPPEADPPRSRTGPLGDGLHFVFLGRGTPEKGFDLLPEAISLLLRRSNRCRFTLQAFSGRPAVVERLAALGPSVRLVHGALDPGALYRVLETADVVLAPYDPQVYALRSSHTFIEALGFGKPVVAVKGSWMESEAASFPACCVFARAFAPEALADAMLEAVRHFEELAHGARRTAALVRDAYSVRGFVDHALGTEAEPAPRRSGFGPGPESP